MNDIVGNTWNSKISHDSNDHENKVGRICRRKESIAIVLHLGYINFQHILLDFANDATEYVSNRQPQKYINVPCYPNGQCVLESIEDSDSEDQWPEYGKNNKIKCPDGIYAEGSCFKQYSQNFTHPLLDRIPKIVRCL